MAVGYPSVNLSGYSGSNNGFFSLMETSQNKSAFAYLHGIDLVITNDQSKWTRCAVIENNWIEDQTIGDATIMELRDSPSKDINGNQVSGIGMSYFPGYAIDVETGERLNMAFGENSWLNGSNGTDMLWNPTEQYVDNVGNPIFGGGHYIYVFGSSLEDDGSMPSYDNANFLESMLDPSVTGTQHNQNFYSVWKNCMWVMSPMLVQNHPLLETDVRIQLRVSHPYQEDVFTNLNLGLPAYRFNTNTLFTTTDVLAQQENKLDLINVVPNPYYGYSSYENNQLDNRIKITNLPERCTITIFNMSGNLVKTISKDNPTTFQDWTLKNNLGIPIASGMYIIHIEVPGVGERILKWFGSIRTVDTENF
jgi:hypothetical protein